MRVPSLWPKHHPKAPLPNTITFQHMNGGGTFRPYQCPSPPMYLVLAILPLFCIVSFSLYWIILITNHLLPLKNLSISISYIVITSFYSFFMSLNFSVELSVFSSPILFLSHPHRPTIIRLLPPSFTKTNHVTTDFTLQIQWLALSLALPCAFDTADPSLHLETPLSLGFWNFMLSSFSWSSLAALPPSPLLVLPLLPNFLMLEYPRDMLCLLFSTSFHSLGKLSQSSSFKYIWGMYRKSPAIVNIMITVWVTSM